MLPVMAELGTVEIPLFERMAKLPAIPRFTEPFTGMTPPLGMIPLSTGVPPPPDVPLPPLVPALPLLPDVPPSAAALPSFEDPQPAARAHNSAIPIVEIVGCIILVVLRCMGDRLSKRRWRLSLRTRRVRTAFAIALPVSSEEKAP